MFLMQVVHRGAAFPNSSEEHHSETIYPQLLTAVSLANILSECLIRCMNLELRLSKYAILGYQCCIILKVLFC